MVTSCAQRARHMVDAVREITGGGGSNFFLFVDRDKLATSDPLQVEWLSGKGEPVRLAD